MAVFSTLLVAAAIYIPIVNGYTVTCNKGLIPNFHDPIPVLTVKKAIRLPTSLLTSNLNNLSPASLLSYQSAQAPGVGVLLTQIGGAVVGMVAADNGATKLFAQYDTIAPSNIVNTAGAAALFANSALFPDDDTVVSAEYGPTLMSVTYYNDTVVANATEPTPLLSYKVASRKVPIGGNVTLPVRGSGSKGVFGYDGGGRLKSLTYAWANATITSTVMPSKVVDIQKAIIAQLQEVAKIAPYTVTRVEPWYYDSSRTMFPVFYFTATRDNNASLPVGTVQIPSIISGYVPIGGTPIDPLPNLTVPPGPGASDPPPPDQMPVVPRDQKKGFVARALGSLRARAPPTVTVGLYVVRDDDAGWTNSANGFWAALDKWNGRWATFVKAQYFWAFPHIFTTNKGKYINAVNIALTEVHGNWGMFTTRQNWADLVFTTMIPKDGYGGGTGGKLAYWVIHACEVIPSEVDYPLAPKETYRVWQHVFNGLHAVLGYRTEMYINDGVTSSFGNAIAQGVPVVGAWLSAVHNDAYWYGAQSPYAQTYYDGNRRIYQPYGRASTMYVCGHAKDVVWNVANLGRATCLQEAYYAN